MSIGDELSKQFHKWENRGRGWKVWDYPVAIEPPFRPFYGHYLPRVPIIDDVRRHTVVSAFFERLLPSKKTEFIPDVEEEEPEPDILERDHLIELQTTLPSDLNISRETFEQFLHNVSLCREPVTFELLGTADKIVTQFAASDADASRVRRQLQGYFPDAVFVNTDGALESSWNECGGVSAVFEVGLAEPFMLPLTSGKLDPFIGLIAALGELQAYELGLFQVIFEASHALWPESIVRSVTDVTGKPFFINASELVDGANKMASRPIFSAVVRIATRAEDIDRAIEIARDMSSSLRVFFNPSGNWLMPLSNADYPIECHEEDVIRRQSRRSGMLLTIDELIGFVHLPSSAVSSSKLLRETARTKAAPAIAQQDHGITLGTNRHAGKSIEVQLSADQRVRHMHIIGASGTGKSTLLFNLIAQDIMAGEGVGVLDPHGDLVERLLGIIPPERVKDVVYVDAADEEYSVGFNILSAHSDFEKTLLASDLVSVFQRLSTSWGDQLGSVLSNAILAFLESRTGGTLSDLRRFLLDSSFRSAFLKTVADPDIVYYWQKGFPQLSGNKSIGSVLTRLEAFLAPKPIRYMVSQKKNTLNFADILDTGKIFLAKLPQGQIGKENAFLLGSLLVAKFQQLAMSRQRMTAANRRNFWLYVDEFHHFITPSMAEILTDARKYRIGLILAHQELRQLQKDTDVAGAVMSNPYTRVVFRVGDADARALDQGFSFFNAQDLQNLGTGQAICRVERSDFDFNLEVPLVDGPDEAEMEATRREVIAHSRKKYATPRAEIEAALFKQTDVEEETTPETDELKKKRTRQEEPTTPVKADRETRIEQPAPQVTEAKPATSEKREEAPPIERSVPEKQTPSPVYIASHDPGKGGAQHKSIQERLQKEAHALGFLALIECQLSEKSMHAADLTLRKGSLSLAVEITITTTVDHEFGNVKKCLGAGFNRVAVVASKPEKLALIEQAVRAGLGNEESAKVQYHTPDSFIEELRKLAIEYDEPAPVPQRAERMSRGYKVRRSSPKLTEEERKAKEELALKIIAESMKQKP